MEKLAKQLQINIKCNPWMFKLDDGGASGWGYRPHTEEQWKFFKDYLEYYPNREHRKWIIQMRQTLPMEAK